MRRFRAAAARGHVNADGVDSRHAFSSGTFHDPAWSGFGALRVLGEHKLEPGARIEHARANMEVLCYVLSGTVTCVPGDGATIGAGTLFWIGAGHGGADAAFTRAGTPAHVLQAWIQPDRINAAPAAGRRAVDREAAHAGWSVLAAPEGAGQGLPLRQQAWLRTTVLHSGDRVAVALSPDRRYWLQVLAGRVHVDAQPMSGGDALAISDEAGTLEVECDGDLVAEVLLFELPGASATPGR